MKQMRFLVLLLLTLTGSWTANCQITGIDREQKIEIVSTLETYDAIIIELNLTEQLLSQAREMIVLLEKQLDGKDKMILNLQGQIDTFNEQVTIQDIEIRKEKRKKSLIILGGAILVLSSIIIK